MAIWHHLSPKWWGLNFCEKIEAPFFEKKMVSYNHDINIMFWWVSEKSESIHIRDMFEHILDWRQMYSFWWNGNNTNTLFIILFHVSFLKKILLNFTKKLYFFLYIQKKERFLVTLKLYITFHIWVHLFYVWLYCIVSV